MKKRILVLIIITSLILITGCWDMVEINQRLYPYSVGIDLNHGEGGDYIVTISYININGIGKNATQEERVFIVSTPASSIYEASKILTTEVPYPFYFKHLRVLILGSDLAQDEHHVKQIIDGLSRDFQINKKLKIAMADGEAKAILESVPKSLKQEEIEGTLFALLQDTGHTARYTSKTLTDLIQGMDQGEVIVPRIKVDGQDIKVYGGCIVKNYKAIGYLNELESRAISFIKDEVKMELIDAPYNGSTISFEVTGQDVKRKLIRLGEYLVMKIDIEVEGNIQEYILMDSSTTHGQGTLQSMEKAIKVELEKQILNVLELLQKKYRADPIGVGEYISKFHPKIWKEIQDDWEEIFCEMDIEISIKPKIRRRGLIQ